MKEDVIKRLEKLKNGSIYGGTGGSGKIETYRNCLVPESTITDAVDEIRTLRIQLAAALVTKTLPFSVGGIA